MDFLSAPNPLNLDLANPNVVEINGNIIDTTATDAISLNASGTDYVYINSNGNIDNDQYTQLQNLGLEIMETIAPHTYMCKYTNSDLDVLRQLPYVRSVNTYAPALKLAGSLKNLLLQQLDLANPRVVVRLHPNGQSADQVAQEISNRVGLGTAQMTISPKKITLNLNRDQLVTIASIDSVGRIEQYVPADIHNEYARGVLAQNWDYSSLGYPNQYFRWRGRGQVICIADTGVDVSHRAFFGRVHKEANLWIPYCNEKSTDPDGHGTHVAGSVVEGVAQESKIIVQGMWSEYGGTPRMWTRDDLKQQIIDAFNDGAYIHTNSWGAKWQDGQTEQYDYGTTATEMDEALNEYNTRVVTVSAGNDGGKRNYLGETGAQNACKNAISVGIGMSLRPNNGFSYDINYPSPDPRDIQAMCSTGPVKPVGNAPGRIKPDVIAPGTAILSAKSAQITPEAYQKLLKDGNAPSNKEQYHYLSGTSMATPHVAGCCAVIREALMSPLGGNIVDGPSGSLVKAILVNGAVDLAGHYYGGYRKLQIPRAPNSIQGHGRVDLSNSIFNIEQSRDPESGTGFHDAIQWSMKVEPMRRDGYWSSPPIPWKTKMFSVTLAYYDLPGAVTKNMLGLQVVNGNQYHCGNMPKRNEGTYDTVNNTQKVVWERQTGDLDTMTIGVKCTRMEPGAYGQTYAVAWMSHE